MGVSIDGVDPFYFLDLPFDRQLALMAYYNVKQKEPKKSKHRSKALAAKALSIQQQDMRKTFEEQGATPEQIENFMGDMTW